MYSNGYPPVSSMSTEELLRVARNMMHNGGVPPVSISQELLNRLTRAVDNIPDVTDVDPKQTSFDFDSK